MKKLHLVLLTLVPILAGWFINLTIAVPVVGTLIFYLLPLAVLYFWFRLGEQYAGSGWNFCQSLAISNAAGIISLILYIWQFLLESDETRIFFISGLSQMYGAAAPVYLFGWLARMFESQPNYIGRNTFLAVQVIAAALFCIVFTCGYIRRKNAQYK